MLIPVDEECPAKQLNVIKLTKKFLEGQPSSRCDAVNQLVHLQSQLAWNKS